MFFPLYGEFRSIEVRIVVIIKFCRRIIAVSFV